MTHLRDVGGVAPQPSFVCREPVEGGIRDLLPALLAADVMRAASELPVLDLARSGRVLASVASNHGHGREVVLVAREEQQRCARGCEVDPGRPPESAPGHVAALGDHKPVKRVVAGWTAEGVGEGVMNRSGVMSTGLSPASGLMWGKLARRKCGLNETTPCGGAELIATPARAKPSLTSRCTSSPPIEWPTRSGRSGRVSMSALRFSLTAPNVRRPSPGSTFERSIFGSPSWYGQLGELQENPAPVNRSTHGCQLWPLRYMPWMKMT